MRTNESPSARPLRRGEVVSIKGKGAAEVVGLLGGTPRRYRVMLLGTRRRQAIVTRDQIED